jgi:hypothetical protein
MGRWSPRINKMILLWLNQVGANRKLHHKVAIELADRGTTFSYLIILFAGISSIGSFVNIFDNIKQLEITLKVVVGMASVIVVMLSAIVAKEKFEERSEKHKVVAGQYSDLSTMIQVTLVQSSKPDPDQFLKRVADQFHFIQQLNPESIKNESSTADLPNLMLIKAAKKKGSPAKLIDIITPKDRDMFDDNVDVEDPFSTDHYSPKQINMTPELIEESEDSEIMEVVDKTINDTFNRYIKRVNAAKTPKLTINGTEKKIGKK